MDCYHYRGLQSNLVVTTYPESLELLEDFEITKRNQEHKIVRWWLGTTASNVGDTLADNLADFGVHLRQNWFCLALPSLIGRQSINFSEVRQNIPSKLIGGHYWRYCPPFYKWFLIYEVSLDSTNLWQILS